MSRVGQGRAILAKVEAPFVWAQSWFAFVREIIDQGLFSFERKSSLGAALSGCFEAARGLGSVFLGSRSVFGEASQRALYRNLIAASFFINLLALAFPLALLQVYDRVIPNHSTDTLLLLMLGVGAAVIFESVLRTARAAMSAWADARYEHDLGCQAFNRFLQSDLNAFEQESAATHFQKMSALGFLRDFYLGQGLIALLDVPFVLVYFALIAYIAGPLVFVPLGLLFVFLMGVLLMGSRLRGVLSARRNLENRRMSFIIEVLRGMQTIKSLALEAPMLQRYQRLQDVAGHRDGQLALLGLNMAALNSFISQLTLVIVVAMGSLMVMKGWLSLGGLAASIFLSSRVLQPVGRIASAWARLQGVHLAQRDLSDIMQLPLAAQAGQKPLQNFQGRVEWRNISLKNDRNNDWLFSGLNLQVNPGEIVTLSGGSLSGKTKLLQLLIGFVVPQQGGCYFDHHLSVEFSSESIREQVRYVGHHSVLFDGTILDNLTLFRGNEYRVQAEQVSRELGIDAIIRHFPQGYATRIGNRSEEALPAGLQQRIAIARALLDEPKVLLLDEANSSMDMLGDNLLREALVKRKGRMTMMIVSNRPSLCAIADRQLVLEKGRLHAK